VATELEQALAYLDQAGKGTSGGFVDQIIEDTQKSFRAAKMIVGLYKPASKEEASELKRRFAADAALLGVSAVTGGAAGALLKTARPVARAILSGALANAAGAAAIVEQEPVLPSLAMGGVAGAALSFPGAALGARGVAKRAAQFAQEEVLGRRKALIAKTSARVQEGQNVTLQGLRKLMEEAPERLAAEQERLRTLPAIEGAAVEPFDLPYRSEFRQRMFDPFSTPQTAAEHLEDLVVDTTRPAFTPRVAALARGTEALPVGERLTIGVQTAETPRGIIKGLSLHTPDPAIKNEAALTARQAFIEFVGGKESGRIAPPGTKARKPRRRGRVSSAEIEDSVLEFLEMGKEKEVRDLALANSVVRRMLLKLPEWGPNKNQGLERAYSGLTDFLRRAFVPVENVLAKMGVGGAELGARMSTVQDRAMARAAEDIRLIEMLFNKPDFKKNLKARVNLAEVLNGSDVPMNEAVLEAATLLRERLDLAAQGAVETGLRVYSPKTGKTRLFQARQNYFPIEYSRAAVRKYLQPGPEHDAALKRIMDANLALSRKEAEAVLRRYLKPEMSEFTYGHLQIARDIVLDGWEKDPVKVLPQYFLRAWKRIETAREFGPKHQRAVSLFQKIAGQGYNARYAEDAYNAFANKRAPLGAELSKLMRSMNVISMLSTAGIVQFAQHSNTIALTGYKNWLQGLSVFLTRTRPTRDWAARTGAYIQELTQDILPYGERSITSQFLQTIGMTPLDKANRIVAAFAGRYYADDLAAKYAKSALGSGEARLLERKLSQLRLDPEAARAAGGILTPEQRAIAAQQASYITQFRGSVLDMPLAKESAAGQFLYVFKNFAIQQTRFVHTLTDSAFRHGDWAPLLRYASATGTLTAGIGEVVAWAKYGIPISDLEELGGVLGPDKKPDREWAQAYVENALTAGALGIASDSFRGLANGPEFLRSFFLGPTFNDALGLLGTDLPELAKGNPQRLLHDTIKHFPLFGRRMADWLVPLE